METTRNTLRAAMAALSAMAVALVAVILVSVHPVFASAAEEQAQGVAEGNISLSVPAATLPCALTADGTVITPNADKYAFVNTGSVAVSIASPEVKLSNDVHDVNMSAKAAVVATTDKDQFKKLFNESDKQIDWVLNNQGQGEQTLMQGQSLCVKFGIDPLTYDKNANVIEQAATSGGCNIASVNYAYREKRMPAYAVFFDNGRTAKLYKGYDRPVKGEPYRGSTEPVFDFVEDIENDKAEVFVPYKNVLEQVSVETEDGEIQPTTTKGWFKGCSKLADVQGLSKLDTSKVTDMSDMFNSCSGLTSLDLSKFDTANVMNMSSMFIGCNGLTTLDVSGFDTAKVTNMSGMFCECYGLTTLDLSKFDTSKVTNMSSMFASCMGLTSLNLSKFDTSKVTDMSSMFSDCSNLTSLVLSSFDTANVTSMAHMFDYCSNLTSLDLSSFDTANVTDMSSMFDGCSGLKSLNVSSFDTANVTDMSSMFDGCSGLTKLDLSSFDTSSDSDVEVTWMFDGCSGLKKVTLKEGWSFKFADCGLPATMYVKDSGGLLAEYKGGFPTTKTDTYYTENRIKLAYAVFFDNGRTAKLYKDDYPPVKGELYHGNREPVFDFVDDIEDDKTDVFSQYNDVLERVSVETEDGQIQPTTTKGWFSGCSKLAGVEGLSKLDTSKATDMSEMFSECSDLTSLDVSKFNTANVTNMSFMFYNCSSLTSLDVSRFATGNVTNMSGMFSQCAGLTSLDVSKFDTSSVTNMSEMFHGCSDLTPLDVSKFNTAKVTDMSRMFSRCSGLTSLDVSKFDTAKVTDMISMFQGCSGLTSLDVSKFNTAKVTVMTRMFFGCSGLEQVTLRGGWDFPFVNCGLPGTMYVKDGSGSFAKYPNVFPTAKTDTYYTENGIKQAFAVIYDDRNGGRAAKLYNRAIVPAKDGVFEGDKVTEVITGIENKPGAFSDKSGGKKLTAVKVVDDDIQPLTTKKWFSGCSKLAGVEGLSKLDTSKVTDMSDMFRYCSGLTSLDLSGFKTDNVENMSGMFAGCESLTSLGLSSFDTANVTDMNFMFQGCWGLKSLGLSSFDTAKVMYMDYMFYECSGLTSLDLSNFDTANVTYMGYMFEQCNKLNTVTFPNDAASKTQLKKALSDCGITLRSNQRTIDEDANALSASDNMESHQCEEGVEHCNLQHEGAAPLSGSTAAAAIIAPSSNVSNAGKTEADSPGQSGGSESKEPSAEKADNCQSDSDGNLSSDKSGSSAHMK